METSRQKRWWHPVKDTSTFKPGDLLWVSDGPYAGYNEVLLLGHKELLLHPLSLWEGWKRRFKHKWFKI